MTVTTSTSSSPTVLQKTNSGPLISLLGFLFLCYAVAAIGALSTASAIPTWYASLNKPTFNPPNWVFAPVWLVLYGVMAIAAWLVWRTPRCSERGDCLMFFDIQLLLNFLWTPVFFYLHLVLVALIIVVLLWIAILLTIYRFWQVHRLAAALTIPYLAWVTFAAALNYQIYRLN